MAVDTDIIVDVTTVNRNKIKEPSKFKVIVYNDDVTTMEFVIALLWRPSFPKSPNFYMG